MTIRHRSGLAEMLETCRPAPQNKPNILKTLLAVQSAMGHVPTSAIPQIAQVLGVTLSLIHILTLPTNREV